LYTFRILEHSSKHEGVLEEMPKILKAYLLCAEGKIEDQTLAAGTIMHLTKSSVLAEKFIFPCWFEVFQLISSGIQILGKKFEK